jgi:integrase
VTLRPTLPFTREEMTKILAATSIYPDKSGKTGRPNALRLRAFCLLLRFSGLRIGDAVSLRTEMLDGNRLFLHTAKTGCPVYCVLPDFVAEALRTMPRLSERYFFWTAIRRCTRNWHLATITPNSLQTGRNRKRLLSPATRYFFSRITACRRADRGGFCTARP